MKHGLTCIWVLLAVFLMAAPAAAGAVEFGVSYWAPGLGSLQTNVGGPTVYDESTDEYWTDMLSVGSLSGATWVLEGSLDLGGGWSLGASYWSLADTNGFGQDEMLTWTDEYGYGGNEDAYVSNFYVFDYAYWGSCSQYWFAAQQSVSHSCLDVTLDHKVGAGGVELTVSPGLRYARFGEDQEIEFECTHDWVDGPCCRYVLTSHTDFSAIGPTFGVGAKKELAQGLALVADGRAGVLFGSTAAEVVLEYDDWDDEEEWVFDGSETLAYSGVAALGTLDVQVGLSYAVSDAISVNAGYKGSAWFNVPGMPWFDGCCWTTQEGSPRNVIYGGWYAGASISF